MVTLKSIISLLAVSVLTSTGTLAIADSENDSVVMAAHSIVAGKSLGEWSAVWWKWAYAIPASDNPLLDTTGANAKLGDVGPVFFLAGWFGTAPGPVTRNVTIPANKYVFFPLLNLVDDNVGNGCTTPTTTPCAGRLTIDQLFAQLESSFVNISALHASIDGVSVGDLFAHREVAPAFSYTFQITDNLAEAVNGYAGPDSAGTVFPAVADGYYLMLRPLAVGHHAINFGGAFSGGFSLDITYQVTVTATPSHAPAMLVP